MTISEAVYKQVRTLALAVLPVDSPVIRGMQNSPAPGEHYIAIMPLIDPTPHGMAHDVQAEDPDYLDHHIDWTCSVDIREVGGDGDWLRLMVEGLESVDLQTWLPTLSVLDPGTIHGIPFKEGNKWLLENNMIWRCATRTTRRELVGYFTRIEATGQIGGHDLTIEASC